jgi:predicted O-methyltransferase YrrM
MFWFRATSFLKFLWFSTNQYGIHSPFIYQFLIRCLYKRISKNHLNRLRENRQNLLISTKVVEVEDFGKGSVQFITKTRRVGDMAKKAGMSLHKSKLINKMVSYFDIKSTLELGTSVGLGSIAMATLQPQNLVESVEACPNTFEVAKAYMDSLQFKNINLYHSKFNAFINNLSHDKKYDLIYVDGHHDEQATLAYFLGLKPHLHSESIVILDDIYWSKGMQNAWLRICKDDSVKVSLDLYFWGILFFRPGLSKQDFKIRCFI